jgi:hypothetical protein
LSDTWRQKDPSASIVSRGKLLAYLNPVGPGIEVGMDISTKDTTPRRVAKTRRVADRPDLQLLLPFGKSE